MKNHKLYLLSALSVVALASCQNPFIPSVTSSKESSSSVESSSQAGSSATSETSTITSSAEQQSDVESSSKEELSSDVEESTAEATTSEEAISSEEATTSHEEQSSASEEVESPGYTTYDPTADRFGLNRDANCFFGYPCMDTLGTQNVLVVPVAMSDAPAFTQSDLNAIDIAYNGDKSETGWESLKSFYHTSSYGQLELNCVITEPYTVSYSTRSFQNNYNSSDTFFENFLEEVAEHAFQSLDRTDFDLDGDGFIDGLQIVYKNDGTQWTNDATEVWWNFTSATDLEGSVSDPVPGVFFWSQFDMIQNGYYDPDIDTHTLVHEMGHMLGADDYYSYDEDGAPAGCVDMMDWNVGDHNAVTKSLFGWVKPFVPDGTKDEFTITLRDFESSGDCLMLIDPESWNGTVYDEYFMLEYYTPTLLNEQDATNGYPEWSTANGGRIYRNPGIKMFHADNRLGKIRYSSRTGGYSFVGFTDEFIDTGTTYSTIVSSNTISVSYSDCRKLELMCADGQNHFINRSYYDNYYGRQALLFGTSEYGCGSAEFNASTASAILKNGTKMNDNTDIPYGFEVIEQTSDEVTIRVFAL